MKSQRILDPYVLDCRGRMLDCGREAGPARVMGVLNVTPDSFSDGGRYLGPSEALRRIEEMLAEGADLIDVGGESTRPRGRVYGDGAEAQSAETEIARVIPVLKAAAARFPEVVFSIDTYKPEVAEAALEHGASMLNDVTGLRYDTRMAELAASFGVPIVLMHSVGRPGAMPHEEAFSDVVSAVTESLRLSIARAEAAGARQLVIDPGFGFGKTAEENLRLLACIDRLPLEGHPVLVGISRKSTIGIVLGSREAPAPIEDRLFGTLGATAVAVLRGARFVRTHDVGPTVQMLKVIHEIERSGEGRVE